MDLRRPRRIPRQTLTCPRGRRPITVRSHGRRHRPDSHYSSSKPEGRSPRRLAAPRLCSTTRKAHEDRLRRILSVKPTRRGRQRPIRLPKTAGTLQPKRGLQASLMLHSVVTSRPRVAPAISAEVVSTRRYCDGHGQQGSGRRLYDWLMEQPDKAVLRPKSGKGEAPAAEVGAPHSRSAGQAAGSHTSGPTTSPCGPAGPLPQAGLGAWRNPGGTACRQMSKYLSPNG
jgi:hypothetical protein